MMCCFGKVWKLANAAVFVNTITVIILINIVLMATESWSQPAWWTSAMDTINYVFIGIYIVEILVKLVAYLHLYFLDPWNIFDLVIVLSSVVESSDLFLPPLLIGEGLHVQSDPANLLAHDCPGKQVCMAGAGLGCRLFVLCAFSKSSARCAWFVDPRCQEIQPRIDPVGGRVS